MVGEAGKKKNTAEIIFDIAQPLAENLGLRIWDVTFAKEGADWFLRIFIDKDGGISIDDCVNMTHAINPVLDDKDPISQEYTLEVSSPGINRKLTKPDHFKRYEGEEIRVKLIRPLEDGSRVIDGVLISSKENGDFEIQINEETTASFVKKECASVILLEDAAFSAF